MTKSRNTSKPRGFQKADAPKESAPPPAGKQAAKQVKSQKTAERRRLEKEEAKITDADLRRAWGSADLDFVHGLYRHFTVCSRVGGERLRA